jgi:hypothetical protein
MAYIVAKSTLIGLIEGRIQCESNWDYHGHFGDVKPKDIEDMVSWVRRFVEEHLS